MTKKKEILRKKDYDNSPKKQAVIFGDITFRDVSSSITTIQEKSFQNKKKERKKEKKTQGWTKKANISIPLDNIS